MRDLLSLPPPGEGLMKTVLAVAGLAVALAGCQTQQVAPQPQAPKSKCDAVAEALSSPFASFTTKQVAMEVGRNNGCFGQPPVQRIQVIQ